MNLIRLAVVAALAAAGVASSVHAAVAVDPAGDFLGTYTGPHNGDLDVLATEVTYNSITGTLTFTGTMNGAIGTTAGSQFVWGLNRGQGTARFVGGTPSVGAGVLFDMVVIMRPDGTGSVNDLISGINTPMTAGSVLIAGSTIASIALPISMFPTRGFAFENYTFNLWPRSPGSGNVVISDFAPDASNTPVTVIPGAGTLAIGAMGLVVTARRRRR